MMKVLVTGASGFVGRAVLAAAPPSISICAVVRSKRAMAGIETCSIPDLITADWKGILRGVDSVIHLAGRAHRTRRAGDSLVEYRVTNVEGTRSLAMAAADSGVTRFVFVSSVKVHGDATSDAPFVPQSPLRPTDAYGRSKAEAEEVLWDIAAASGLPVTVVRPPLVYGPGVRANFLALLRLVDAGVPLPFASIRNRRSLVYVRNLADLLLHCTAADGTRNQKLLVSDGPPMSTPELVRAIAGYLNRPVRLIPAPPALLRMAARVAFRTSEVERLVGSLEVDASETARLAGWTPPFSSGDGLAETCRWFQREHNDDQ